jgi:hypothetical protein
MKGYAHSQLVADRKSVDAFVEDVNAKMGAWRQDDGRLSRSS